MINFMDVIEKLEKKDISDLKDIQIAFVRARKTYLSDEQKKHFAPILGDSSARLYQEMTMPELRRIAAEKNVKLNRTDKKPQIIEKISK